MTREEKYAITKDRYNRLSSDPKNWKSSGVCRKLKRKLRQLEK